MLACSEFGLRGFGLRHRRIGHHMDIAAEFAVQSGDAIELRTRHLRRGNFTRLDTCRERSEFKVVQIVDYGIHSLSPSSIRRSSSGGGSNRLSNTGITIILVTLAVNQ
jgi:hypothetical protein